MRDVVWTIIVIWVVWKIIDSIKARTVVFQRHEHHHHNASAQREGNVSIDQSNVRKPNRPVQKDDGEYVDYEEIK